MQSLHITIAVLVAVVVGLAYLGAAPETAQKQNEAFAAAKHFVRQKLVRPETAVFPEREYATTQTGQNRWLVKSYVDSQNLFGATVRANWAMEVERRPEGWYRVAERGRPLEH